MPLIEALADRSLTALLTDDEVMLGESATVATFEIMRAAIGIDSVAVIVRPLDGVYGQGCD